MSFRREKVRTYYLHDTPVENLFINEYMADAPGEYVKAYLLALMFSSLSMQLSHEDIAKHLSMETAELGRAWDYWEARGVVEKVPTERKQELPYNIRLRNLKEQIYGQEDAVARKAKKTGKLVASMLEEDEIRDMFRGIEKITGRPLEGTAPQKIVSWLSEFDLQPGVILAAFEHCKEMKTAGLTYVGRVINEWGLKGLHTESAVRTYLEETDQQHCRGKRVMKALGFHRSPTEKEEKMIQSWFSELGLDMETVLDACGKTSGISNPNINYVDRVIRNRLEGASGRQQPEGRKNGSSSIRTVMDSYETDRRRNEEEAEARRKEIYRHIPRIEEIEKEIRNAGMEISRVMLSGRSDAEQKMKAIRNQVEERNAEIAYLLTENNFAYDYLDVRYTCSKCKDTGLLDDGTRCSCFEEKLKKQEKELK